MLSHRPAPESSSSSPDYTSSSEITELESSEEESSESPSESSAYSLPESSDQSSSQSSSNPYPSYNKYSVPKELRGITLTPGIDFLTNIITEDSVRAEIDSVIETVKENFNTLIVNTRLNNSVIYTSSYFSSLFDEFDIMQYIIKKASDENMFVYAVYDLSPDLSSFSISSLESLSLHLAEFSSNYRITGIILDGYYSPAVNNGYSSYSDFGAAMGYENYLYETSLAIIKTACDTVSSSNPQINIGLLASPVWANVADNSNGSDTFAEFTSLYSKYCDVRNYISSKFFDFIAVDCYGSLTDSQIPFANVFGWWNSLADANKIEMYPVLSSDKICTAAYEGWLEPDELLNQIKEIKNVTGKMTSIFNSYSGFFADTNGSASIVITYYNGEEPDLGPMLQMSSPSDLSVQTESASFTFVGTSDPNYSLTVNDKKISRSSTGSFSYTVPLRDGDNIFTFVHKNQTFVYTITRNLTILKQTSPTSDVFINGNTEFSVDVWAFSGAYVTAVFAGDRISLFPAPDDDYSDVSSDYTRYTGVFTAPKSSEEAKSYGKIVFFANCDGKSEIIEGPTVTVNPTPSMPENLADAVMVEVVSDHAKTFSANKLGNEASLSYFSVAKGMRDYIVGDEITYGFASESYSYYLLSSGRLIKTTDVKKVSSETPLSAEFSSLTVSSDNQFTSVIIGCSQKIPYTITIAKNTLSVNFNYLSSSSVVNLPLTKNPLFSNAHLENSTLTLSLINTNGLLGISSSYDDSGNLVILCPNPPIHESSPIVVVIDPNGGTSSSDIIGVNGISESKISNMIANSLADKLLQQGAEVLLVDKSEPNFMTELSNNTLSDKPHFFISLKANYSSDPSLSGVSVKYTSPISKLFASKLSASAADSLGLENNGIIQGAFTRTSSSEFISAILEYGYLSNENDCLLLESNAAVKDIVDSVFSSVVSYFPDIFVNIRDVTGTESFS